MVTATTFKARYTESAADVDAITACGGCHSGAPTLPVMARFIDAVALLAAHLLAVPWRPQARTGGRRANLDHAPLRTPALRRERVSVMVARAGRARRDVHVKASPAPCVRTHLTTAKAMVMFRWRSPHQTKTARKACLDAPKKRGRRILACRGRRHPRVRRARRRHPVVVVHPCYRSRGRCRHQASTSWRGRGGHRDQVPAHMKRSPCGAGASRRTSRRRLRRDGRAARDRAVARRHRAVGRHHA